VALKSLAQSPALTPEEALELLPLLRSGDRATRERYILGNARFVLRIVNGFAKPRRLMADQIEELEGVAMLTLTTSVDDLAARTPPSDGSVEYPSQYIRCCVERELQHTYDAFDTPFKVCTKTIKRRRQSNDEPRSLNKTGPKALPLPEVSSGKDLGLVGVDVFNSEELEEEILACAETPVERAVIGTLMMGLEVPAVAEMNELSEKSVYTFRRRVLQRLDERCDRRLAI